MARLSRRWLRRLLKLTLAWRIRPAHHRLVWIDVGAHEGETTMPFAAARPDLIVYAFEPNPAAAGRIMGRLRNYVVLPMAVTAKDGMAELKVSAYEASSSLLDMDARVKAGWMGGEGKLDVVGRRTVPTIRLDTFMDGFGIKRVNFLKIDAQGADLDVVRSAGARLAAIDRIQVEVATKAQLYRGGAPAEEVLDFMAKNGFGLVDREEQTFGQEANLTFVRSGGGHDRGQSQ